MGGKESVVLTGFGAPIYVDRDLSFKDSVNHKALAYWQGKLRSRAMPARADIDPIEMRAFVTNVALVEVRTDGATAEPVFRIRLAGTAVEEVFGPLTGRTVAELPKYFAGRWQALFMAALTAAAPVRITTDVTLENKDHLTAEALIAPLSEDGAAASILFVCVRFWPQSRPPKPR
jgi:hypothetical protein